MTGTITKEDFLNQNGNFVYFWGYDWFIETPIGNFHWKDPDYGGDNTVTPYPNSIKEFCIRMNCDAGRGKGIKDVRRACGEDIKFVPFKIAPGVSLIKSKRHRKLMRRLSEIHKKIILTHHAGGSWAGRPSQHLVETESLIRKEIEAIRTASLTSRLL